MAFAVRSVRHSYRIDAAAIAVGVAAVQDIFSRGTRSCSCDTGALHSH